MAVLGVASALQLLPGTATLDHHACMILSPVVGLAAAHLTLRLRPNPGGVWRVIAVTLGPLGVFALGALRRPWCAPWMGLAFYLAGPLGSAFVGACAAFIARRLAGRRAIWAMYGIFVLISVRPAWHFLASPQVSAWHGLLGAIPGPIYEDGVRVTWTSVSFRLLDLALWCPAVAWIAAGHRSPARRLAPLVWVTAAAVACFRAGPDGWHVGQAELRAALPVRATVTRGQLGERDAPLAPGLVLHMPGGRGLDDARAGLVQDAAVRWVQLRSFFGRAPSGPVHVFAYADADTRQRLMGAGRVDMAKPWLRQVHIALPRYGASVLKHELAHVFAAAFAPPPLGVPLRGGWMPDALLIEGMATAAQWPILDGLDPHGQARAMRRLGLAPPLQSLLSTGGFLLESGPRAYTLAGSFVRWVRQRHGRRAMNRLYLTADALEATGVPLPELIARWERFVDSDAAGRLTAAHLARARARFERPGLLFRPCVLATGRARDRAARDRLAGNLRDADAVWRELLVRLRPHLGGRPPALDITIARASARCSVNACDEAAGELSALVADGGGGGRGLSRLQRARLLAARGDLALQRGDTVAARRDWRAALEAPVSEGFGRLLAVQIGLSDHESGRRFVRRVLALGGPVANAERELERLVRARPTDPLARYLEARWRLLRRGEDDAARRLAGLALALNGPGMNGSGRVRRACLRLAALHAARRGRCKEVHLLVRGLGGAAGAAELGRRLGDRCRISRALASRGVLQRGAGRDETPRRRSAGGPRRAQ